MNHDLKPILNSHDNVGGTTIPSGNFTRGTKGPTVHLLFQRTCAAFESIGIAPNDDNAKAFDSFVSRILGLKTLWIFSHKFPKYLISFVI